MFAAGNNAIAGRATGKYVKTIKAIYAEKQTIVERRLNPKERFQSGWAGIFLRLRASEVDALIDALSRLRESGHFHLRAIFPDDSGEPGIADIEIALQGDDEIDNLRLDA